MWRRDAHHQVCFLWRVNLGEASPTIEGGRDHVEWDIAARRLLDEDSLRRLERISYSFLVFGLGWLRLSQRCSGKQQSRSQSCARERVRATHGLPPETLIFLT